MQHKLFMKIGYPEQTVYVDIDTVIQLIETPAETILVTTLGDRWPVSLPARRIILQMENMRSGAHGSNLLELDTAGSLEQLDSTLP